jgi:hypothetical protein
LEKKLERAQNELAEHVASFEVGEIPSAVDRLREEGINQVNDGLVHLRHPRFMVSFTNLLVIIYPKNLMQVYFVRFLEDEGYFSPC